MGLERTINIIPHFKAQGSVRKKIKVHEVWEDKLEYQITKFQLPSGFCPFLNYFATMCNIYKKSNYKSEAEETYLKEYLQIFVIIIENVITI